LKERLGKWKQFTMFSGHPLLSKYIPETKKYTIENLIEMLDRHEHIYLKNDRGGQGKGIFKVTKSKEGLYRFNGYTMKGEKVKMDVAKIKDFEPVLHPITRFGGYIVQEGVNSTTLDGFPLAIRVHVQILKDKWLIGGMYGKVAKDETTENGIIKTSHSPQLMMVETLLSDHLKMKKTEIDYMIKSIQEISVKAAEISAESVPEIEYGVDFGIKDFKELILFEINTSPGVSNFSKIDNKEMRERIKAIRAAHLKGQKKT